MDIYELENRLWGVADELRANSDLKASDYSVPVLGLIFLKYADVRFRRLEKMLAGGSGRRKITKIHYQAEGVLYLPEEARYSSLMQTPEGEDIGAVLNGAMKAIERENDELKDVLPKAYQSLGHATLFELLKTFNSIPDDLEGDAFGKIYEYFLGKFAMSEGQKGGQFFTPTSVVKLIVEVIEPYHGRIYDPACGSGGMFVQSAEFVSRHRKSAAAELSVFGQERVLETVRLAKMNLAVHGLSGDIRQGNTYYEDLHQCVGKFDYVMANPPFNVNKVDKERIKDDPRFPFGMPRNDNANYLWIQQFHASLNNSGRAGFVMANSASDARQSEMEIRKKLIQSGSVDVMVILSSNFFYTVTLPVTLWFFDKAKIGTGREDSVLFIDARNIYRQIDRAHRDFTEGQLQFVANMVRLYRGENVDEASSLVAGNPTADGAGTTKLEASSTTEWNLETHFPDGSYRDIPGLCKIATRAEIEEQGWSLNPGRYVGVAETKADDFDFAERLAELNEELQTLNAEARTLEERITQNVTEILS